LIEVTTTLAVEFVVDKIVEQAAAPFKNSKKYATDLMAQAGWATVMSVARNEALPYFEGA
jgi:hypothetical protein